MNSIPQVVDLKRTTSLPWPKMADDGFYGLPGEIVRSIDPYTEADPTAVLIHILVAFGNIIGSGAHAVVQSDKHPARIFAVIIGASSKGRKGTSWSTPRELFSQIDHTWSARRVRSGLSSGEGLIYHVRDPLVKTVPVRKKGRIIDYEKEIEDAGESDKRLLCIESEFSTMLKIMGRDGSSLSGVIRQAWDDGNLCTLTRNNPLHATGAHVSIIGHTTQDELTRTLWIKSAHACRWVASTTTNIVGHMRRRNRTRRAADASGLGPISA